MPPLTNCPPLSKFLAGLMKLATQPTVRKTLLLATCLAAAFGLPNAARHAFADSFVVTNTNDSGAGSLRQAILDANATPGLDTIKFAIGGGGVPTIQPLSPLPAFTSPVQVLATNADGSNCNTWPPTIGVELNGTSAGAGVDGLRFAAGSSGSQVSGFAINRFSQDGIDIATPNIVVACNFIGVDKNGTTAAGNAANGLLLGVDVNTTTLGRYNPWVGNVIAFNQGNGILLNGSFTGNRIQGNSIVSNTQLGIDLLEGGPSGTVTPNDAGDADNGPNGLQNFPVLSTAYRVLPSATVVKGSLNSAANTTYQLEFFSSSVCDASGYGEGERFLGNISVTTDNTGNISFTEGLDQLAPSGSRVVATATDPNGNTSEFSACFAVAEASPETSNPVLPRGDAATTSEDTPITIDVLANDQNLGANPLVISSVGATLNGVTAIVNNRIVFTPSENFNGSTVFFYDVHNGLITKTVQASVRVVVTPVNDPPSDILLSPSTISENQPAGTRVGFLIGMDPDGDTDFVFSLVVGRNTDNGFFSVGRNSLYSQASFDFETRNSYTVRLRATDRNGAYLDKSLVINVLNTNDAPTAIRLRNNRVAENQLAGVSVGAFSSVDPDMGDTFTYALVAGAGSNHNANFSLDGNTLKTNTALDYEAQMIHSIRVRSTDQRGAYFEQTFAIYVDDVPSPPDAPVNSFSKCNNNSITLIDANANNAPKRVLVKIDNVVATNKTATGCSVSGSLTLMTNGNTKTGISFTGVVNDKDQFASGTLSDFNLNVVGLTLQAREVSVAYYLNRPTLVIAKPVLQLPSQWSGLSKSLPLPSLIDANGLRLSTGKVSLPTIRTRSGMGLDLSGSLVAVGGGYEIVADGELSIPNIGKTMEVGHPGQTCTIAAGVTIYEGVLGQTEMRIETIETADTYEEGGLSPAAFDVLRLQQIRASLNCETGIAIGSTGMYLTSLTGVITLTPDNESVNVTVKIVGGKKLPGLGTVLGLDGSMNLQINPTFRLDLGVAVNLLSFKISTANATMTKSSFASTIRIVGTFMEATASINAWSKDGKFHFTGSGRVSLQINKGAISSSCADLPCGIKICKKYGIPYPCGVNYCSVCINIPPANTGKLAEVGVDVGEFTNGRWGFKGFISIAGKTVGFYVDERGTLSFGNVQQYQLIQGPNVAAAHAAWLQSLKSGLSLKPEALGPYSFSDDGGTPSVIINTPLIKSSETRRQPLDANGASVSMGATDVISKVNLIKEADVSFGLKSRGPLTFTLITPQGNEITPQALPSNVVYTSSASYERESGEVLDATQARLRYTPLSTDPSVNGVDVRVDGVVVYVNTSSAAPELLDYVVLTPGTHAVDLVKTGSSQVVLSRTVELSAGYDYSLLTVRSVQNPLAVHAPEASSELLLIGDDNRPPAAPAQASVKLYNGFSINVMLFVDGQVAVGNLPRNATSNYDVLAAGRHTLQLFYLGGSIPASAPTQIDVVEGGVYTFLAAEDPQRLNAAALLQRSDETYVRNYTSEYSVDQANLGEWKAKLVGDTDHTFYLISVAGPASPPVLSALTVNASNPAATQVSWRLVSDNSPTNIQLYINPGPITHSITVTGTNGLPDAQDVPAYEGYVVAEFVMTGTAQLNGQVINRVIDLSKLPSGTYHLWLRAQDGVSPPVNGYASALNTFARSQPFDAYGANTVRVAKNGYSALAQLTDAATIVIDHANDFPTTWAATISTVLTTTNDVGALYVQWNAQPHPDVDNYRLLFSTNAITATQVITVGGAVAEFDENGRATAGEVGFTTLNNIEPGAIYSLTIEAVDSKLNRSVRSQSVAFSASPGSFALSTPQASVAITRNAQLTVPVSLVELQPLFFKQVALSTDMGQAPLGINAGFVDDVDGTTMLSPSQPTAQLVISVDGAVPDGRYRVVVLGYNGNQKQSAVITVVVGNPKTYVYLPLINR